MEMFKITERFSTDFQVVFTNLFNHDQFGDPNGGWWRLPRHQQSRRIRVASRLSNQPHQRPGLHAARCSLGLTSNASTPTPYALWLRAMLPAFYVSLS